MMSTQSRSKCESSSAEASTFFLIALIIPSILVLGSSSVLILLGVSAAPQSVSSVEWRNEDGSWTVTTGGWAQPVLPDYAGLAALEQTQLEAARARRAGSCPSSEH
jgi:hypothetical protein